jgi:hypothetical protein
MGVYALRARAHAEHTTYIYSCMYERKCSKIRVDISTVQTTATRGTGNFLLTTGSTMHIHQHQYFQALHVSSTEE